MPESAAPAAPVLAVHQLSTYYGTSQVLFDVDLEVGRRGGVAVLGRNGAGKTTLMKTIVGELRPRRGRIELDGRDQTRIPTEQRVRWGLGYVPQEHAVFGRLTVRENLVVGAMAARDPSSIDEVVALFPKLGQRLSQSLGVGISATLLSLIAGDGPITVPDFKIVFILIALLMASSALGFRRLKPGDGWQVSGYRGDTA